MAGVFYMASVETPHAANFVNNISGFRQEAGSRVNPGDIAAVYDALRWTPSNAAHAHRMGVAASHEAINAMSEATPELEASVRALALGANAVYLNTANRNVRQHLGEGVTALRSALSTHSSEVAAAAFTTAAEQINMAHELGQHFPTSAGIRHPGALREFAAPTLETGNHNTAAARYMASAAVLLGSMKPTENYGNAAMAGARILNAQSSVFGRS